MYRAYAHVCIYFLMLIGKSMGAGRAGILNRLRSLRL